MSDKEQWETENSDTKKSKITIPLCLWCILVWALGVLAGIVAAQVRFYLFN